MAKKTIKDINVKNKTVLVRVDFNLPMSKGEITDDNRIRQALPTLKYLLDQDAKLVLFSHLGRVKSEEDKAGKSLQPIAKALADHLDQPVDFVNETRGALLEEKVKSLKPRQVLMVENTRFEDIDGKKESKNDEELGKYWASLGDVFVNDAFGTAHRAHASNVGIATNSSEAVSGFLIQKEIDFIGNAVNNPDRPFVAILGGVKVSDKIGVIRSLIEKADLILIGGGMSYTFLKAQGINVGTSIVEEEKIDLAKSLLKEAEGKIVLPVDFKTTDDFSNDTEVRIRDFDKIEDNEMGLDIGPKTLEKYTDLLKDAKTIVWNGPVGVYEFSNFSKGTIGLCSAIKNLKDATSILGGGDIASAAINFGFEDAFSHISTGGGASLEYLEGKVLPGIDCLDDVK